MRPAAEVADEDAAVDVHEVVEDEKQGGKAGSEKRHADSHLLLDPGHTTLLLAVSSRRPSVRQSSGRTARDLRWAVSSLAACVGSLTAVWNMEDRGSTDDGGERNPGAFPVALACYL